MKKALAEIADQEERIRIKKFCGNSLARSLPKKDIQWETDINKINLNQLRNGNLVDDCTFLRTETLRLGSPETLRLGSPESPLEELINSGDESYLDLFALIEKGIKIIPPIYVEPRSFVDGELNIGRINFLDGSHRKEIARAYGLKEIPILVFTKSRVSYFFTPGEWQFDIRAKEEPSGTIYNNCLFAKNGKKEIFLTQGWVDVKNNLELLEITVPIKINNSIINLIN